MFITDEATEISLHNDLFAFKFQYDLKTSLDQYQQQMNKTYIVPIAFFVYKSPDIKLQKILNIIECTDPQLQGYSCVDFSSINNFTLIESVRNNIRSQLQLVYYPCPITDSLKTTVPNNCANQTEIEDFVNGETVGLNLKLYTYQFNISSQQNQVNYMRKFIYTESDQYIINRLNPQQQITKISQGLIIQSENQYSGPINYNSYNDVFSNQFDSPYIQINFEMDQIVQFISIQFPTIPDILALANSGFALLLTLGFIFRMVAQRDIFQDFLHVFLQNMYQDTYEVMLKANKVCEDKLSGNNTLNQVLVKANEEEVQERENTQDANHQKDEIIEINELNIVKESKATHTFANQQKNQNLVNDLQTIVSQASNLDCFISKLKIIKDQSLSENQKNKRNMETMEKQVGNQILKRLDSKIQKTN
ncbi:transmembrane protein, putative (macronuclear) [Tetrahymena thermophila SB210]|uniref:Transmembrane protein, putative n=1 Tax=Tetrahymena thermophila (strain SB210) TaxID=312017 RepID=Q23GC7_TETTS|nr:transmembrane protein, putative [Tetrahymena thermophila SB210]EAR95333.2 transmembrane protein, putative [Tetrahymena thermophila SB210]|eukprot:XP_001015578.2 transmembrane protein, putative [Tetrahymena thermophila SB210]